MEKRDEKPIRVSARPDSAIGRRVCARDVEEPLALGGGPEGELRSNEHRPWGSGVRTHRIGVQDGAMLLLPSLRGERSNTHTRGWISARDVFQATV